MDLQQLWTRYQEHLCEVPALEMTLDVSRMRFGDDFLNRMGPSLQHAFEAMDELEKGEIANPDEKRMVGHYWLRDPERAPTAEIRSDIEKTLIAVRRFAKAVHSGKVRPPKAKRFRRVLCIGIGGSALGPMFVADALGSMNDRMEMSFIDNTDPDGVARTLERIGAGLRKTLCIVTSKGGSTPETNNGMQLVAEAYRKAKLNFAKHAVAITMPGSKMDEAAQSWLERFPMFDWIGGRTSELSVVGLLPAALQGLPIRKLIEGAAACDDATREHSLSNPAAMMALMWYHATGGKGEKDMVVLPYKDRLLLFSRYLQQLVMESLGKRLDLKDRRVDQGLTVYGNKGSTDQHAYVQQLRDGVANFFTIFIRVLESGGSSLEVSDGATAGDYLHGFLLGTRAALYENDRESMTITIPRVDARTVGGLIALFERAVGFYASLIGINAYHQPGVQAGKVAATSVLDLQAKILTALSRTPQTAEQIATDIGAPDEVETVYLVAQHLAANGRAKSSGSAKPDSQRFKAG
jgi:glucose-6-phosphate isomerase